MSYIRAIVNSKRNYNIYIDNKSIIENFLKTFNQEFVEDILGIVFYGSRNSHQATDDSDFDFFLIMKNDSQFGGKKGISKVNNIAFDTEKGNGNCKIEVDYRTANFDDIKNNIKHFADIGDYYLYSSLCKGNLIYSKDILFENNFKNLKNQIIDTYAKEYGKCRLSEEDILSQRISIINAIDRIKKIHNETKHHDDARSDTTRFLYYNLIETIRMYYCNLNGYPYIQTYRVNRVYSDESYKKSLFGDIKIADEEFIKYYLRCISEYRTEEEIIERLEKSYPTSTLRLSEKFKSEVESLKYEMIERCSNLFNYVTKDMPKLDLNGTIDYQYTKTKSKSWY